MSKFIIFAFILTLAYMVYYTILIIRDLHGKEESIKSSTESIDVKGLLDNEEKPVDVEEKAILEAEINPSYKVHKSEDGIEIYEGLPTDTNKKEDKNKLSSKQLNESISDETEEIQPDYSFCLSAYEYQETLCKKRKIGKENVLDNI